MIQLVYFHLSKIKGALSGVRQILAIESVHWGTKPPSPSKKKIDISLNSKNIKVFHPSLYLIF